MHTMNTLLRHSVLVEGITHLEELSLDDFIKTVETLKNKVVTEKLDGANLWFGIDESGLYTSREGKSPKKGRFYSVDDYAMVSNYNGFRAAHLALEAVESTIRKHLQEGDAVEIEVLFGRQPNTVTYGSDDKNFIVILRPVNETPQERVDALSRALNNKRVKVESTIVSSPDGDAVELDDVQMVWEFTDVKPIDTRKVDTSQAQDMLKQLKSYLSKKNEQLSNLTNKEVAELSLTSIPKEQREAAKKERERVNAFIMNEYKVPIKELLLNNFVRKIKPFLQSKDLHPAEDIGVEGVVVRDPETGEQTKIVDKDVFTAINTFNSSVRAGVAGLVRTLDQDAASEMRGGEFGQAKIRIADLLGAKDLALSSGAKRFAAKFKKNSADETAKAIADSLNISSFNSTKVKIIAVLKNAVENINAMLDGFKKEAGEYKLKLKTGKEIGLSPEVMKKTLTAFAETKKDINEVISAVSKSADASQLVMALYGRTIQSLFDEGDKNVKESFKLLRSISEEGEGGGDAGAGAPSGDAPSGGQMPTPVAGGGTQATTAGAIAPFAGKLFGNKLIVRRKRNFVKPKKFPAPYALTPVKEKYSLIKSVSEDWAHVTDMKFATDVDDSAAAQTDVEFKQLRNNVQMGDNVSQSDVNNYLDKAHELNDEVDTVTFGMETDTGAVIKVYVNAQQADEFEKALSELLGEEDDVEEAINKMAEKFDIVDVEWPPEMQPSAEQPTEDDLPSDDELSSEEPPADEELDIPDEEPEIDYSVSGEEEPAEDEEDVEGEDKKKKKKSKKQPTETEEGASMTTYGEKFKQKLLAEAKKPAKKKEETEGPAEDPAIVAARQKFESQIEDLLDVFRIPQERAVLTLMIYLGAPIKALKMHKAELRGSIKSASERFMKDNSFKMWIKKLIAALTAAEIIYEENEFSTRLSNKYQRVIYGVLKGLGMPDSVEKVASRGLLKNVRGLANAVVKDENLRIYLMAVAEELGVEVDARRNAKEPSLEEAVQVLEAPVTPEEMKEKAKQLLAVMGLNLTRNISIEKQLEELPYMQAAYNRMDNLSVIPRRMDALINDLKRANIRVQPQTGSRYPQQNAGVEAQGRVIAESAEEVDWNIAKMGKSGVTLVGKGITIKLPSDEAEKLVIAIGDKKKVAVLAKGGDEYGFFPHKKAYIVKKLGDDTQFPDGILINQEQVEAILDLMAEE